MSRPKVIERGMSLDEIITELELCDSNDQVKMQTGVLIVILQALREEIKGVSK